MKKKNIVILGSTGSIGISTLEVVANHPDSFKVIALSAYSNAQLLAEQYQKFQPDYLHISDSEKFKELKNKLGSSKVEILTEQEELTKLAGLNQADIIVNAIVGSAGLLASLEAVKHGKTLALANKESLVTGGPLFPKLLKKHNSKILPIDSEHSAIWQALASGKQTEVRRLLLTASGGPFRELPRREFEKITLKQALNHPTWNMGSKITIDSATLANKALEIMEAVILFDIPVEKIKVVVHPQSIIHSMVEYIDSSVIAQLSNPDMKLPISYALFWPDRVESSYGAIDLAETKTLTFENPDLEKFKALKLGIQAAGTGGTAPAIFNAANEIAVEAFLQEAIKFTEIADTIDFCLQKIVVVSDPSLDNILETDNKTRELADNLIGNLV